MIENFILIIEGENGIMRYFLVNTNERYDQGATEYSTSKNEVIVYGSLKESINKLKSGDGIFLYKKENGIVAFGIVENDNVTKRVWGDDEMYSKDLCKFIDFSNNPIKFMAQGGKFMNTIVELTKEDLEKIKDKLF